MKLVISLLLVSISIFAQSSSRFAITESVIAGGGATWGSSARFQLGSTIGQPLATAPSSSRFSVQGGFWIWPASTFSAPVKVGTNFVILIQTQLGKTYTVQYTDSLTPATWQNLPSVAGNGSMVTVTDSPLNVTKRFYRLIEQ